MTASLLNGGCKTVCGAITSGGTQSIVMSAKAHRQWAEVTKGITRPEIICASSKHAAIEKACDLLRINKARGITRPSGKFHGRCGIDAC
jgi:glutamate/tyrosine decarboxylase-like PLP-dependent enzyme